MEGQIIKIISNLYTVNSNGKIYECHSRGKFRNDNISPMVGDFVKFDKENNYILEMLPRHNELERPLVSNIDQGLIVTSLKGPLFSPNLLDKLLVVMEFNKIKPIICLTKNDLLTKEEKKDIKKYVKYYKKLGYKVLYNTNLFRIKRLFKGKTTVFTGQSGAGKSTLINKLDKKHLNDKRFLLICLIPIVLHGVWDMPINTPYYLLQITLTVAAWLVIIYFINLGLKQIDDAKKLESKKSN